MDYEEFRIRGKEVVDFVTDYLKTIRERRVFPDVEPGYMRKLVPENAPSEGEDWETIFKDFQNIVLPGLMHWQSPYNHAYFPANSSPISLLAEMLTNGINCLGFTWASSPACTELEIIATDWLASAFGLPKHFHHSDTSSKGGGTIMTTCSEATLVSLLAARRQAINCCTEDFDGERLSDAEVNSRLVAYCSEQAHSSVEKSATSIIVTIRLLPSDDDFSLRGNVLREAVRRDLEKGLIPFYVCATLGTTGACAFDNLKEIGAVCQEFKMWLHIDAAYAGSAFVCPEFRWAMQGIEKADSFVVNSSKWFLVHFDCTAFWVKDSTKLHRTFNTDPLYLRHEKTGKAIDFMHWQIPLSKRFRALKLWFVMRSYGIQGLQAHIRKGVRLAKEFEELIANDVRFEIPAKRHLGLVVFRLKGDNVLTEKLLRRLNGSGLIHMVPASIKGQYIIRYAVTSPETTSEDIQRDFVIISKFAAIVIKRSVQQDEKFAEEALVNQNGNQSNSGGRPRGAPKLDPRRRFSVGNPQRTPLRSVNRNFGVSLVLSNVPCSPIIVDGSFAAFTESQETREIRREEFIKRIESSLKARQSALRPRVRLAARLKQLSQDQMSFQDILTPEGEGREVMSRRRNNSLDSKVEEMFLLGPNARIAEED